MKKHMKKTIVRRQNCTENLDDSDLHPLLKKIYASRGVTHSEEVEYELNKLLPFSDLKEIHRAVIHLAHALKNRHHIIIVGDFDADGATSTACAVSVLRAFGAHQVSYLVPNRFEYGYGLTPEIVRVAAQRHPDLLITVDNGVSSLQGVAEAKALGMKVIITDHHLTAETLPLADAIVNPNQPGDVFGSKNLAGVGVIFYVLLALRVHLREIDWFKKQGILEPNMAEYLDLVALGTVADVVPLDRNNRILVHQGIQRIKKGKARPGIQALMTIAGRQNIKLTSSDLGFAVAPRLNAAGRLEDMSLGIECLLAKDLPTAQSFAARLDQLNQERQSIESEMQQQAISALKQLTLNQNLPVGVCLYDADWHQGVIGIVAARIKERVHRPVIVFAKVNEQELKGSARSIHGFHMRDALDAVAKRHPMLIQKFGGHAMAAGLSLTVENYPVFAAAFAKEAEKRIDPQDLQGKIISDGELGQENFTIQMADLLRNASPWGQEFSEPLFDNFFILLQQRLVANKHLKMLLALPQAPQQPLDAIAFHVDPEHWPNHGVKKIHAAYRLDVNEFRGERTLQLIIEHYEAIS